MTLWNNNVVCIIPSLSGRVPRYPIVTIWSKIIS